jgi:hypothetical protein
MPGPRFEPSEVGSRPKVLAVHLTLMQYPILADKIRERMRETLFARGIVTAETFEQEVREKAIESQLREQLAVPLLEEPEEIWQRRLGRVRDILTEFYFALNLRPEDFLHLVEECLQAKRPSQSSLFPPFNPELAPWKMLFEQGKLLEQLPDEERRDVGHDLREIIVVLTKGMLSDQLSFVGIAKDHLAVADLEWVHARRIGRGKIGGKAGGIVLARSILHRPEPGDPLDFQQVVGISDSYFVGADVHYDFLDHNNLSQSVNYKYMPIEELRTQYPRFVRRTIASRIPENHRHSLRGILEAVGRAPLIVRSSSLLEDNFGVAFAGKYDSFFLPNQGTLEENLDELCNAIKRTYASVLSPDAIMYRQQKELIDYDERMAVLVQRVEGERYHDLLFPTVAGVGFSHNPLTWSPRIDRSQGFLRIVAGLGTRAVDRLDDDYALMVALSHPTLQPTKNTLERIQYTQKFMDVIDLRENRFETRAVAEVLDAAYPDLRHVASLEQGGELQPVLVAGPGADTGRIVLTFDGVLRSRPFTDTMKAILHKLERHYRRPVDIEFTVHFDPASPVGFQVRLLQCRQQSLRIERDEPIPDDVPESDVVLRSRRMVSSGHVENIGSVVYVDPEQYQLLGSTEIKRRLARLVGVLNVRLAEENYILVGPGRWGSSNIDLGVPVTYGDIYNARLLVEVALAHGEHPPEASYGTHFFQDLVESNILPLPIYPGEEDAFVDYSFFRAAENSLAAVAPEWAGYAEYLKVIDVRQAAHGRVLEVIMNGQQERALGFFRRARE